MSASAGTVPLSASVQINPMNAAIAASYSSEVMSVSVVGEGGGHPQACHGTGSIFLH